MDALFGVLQSKIILFFLYHLGHNGQLFELSCHQLNHCVQNEKNKKQFSLESVHKLLEYISSHSTCTD